MCKGMTRIRWRRTMVRSLEEIEKAVSELAPVELREFRAWYLKFDAELWDGQIEADVEAGRLEALAEAAINEHRAGKSRKL